MKSVDQRKVLRELLQIYKNASIIYENVEQALGYSQVLGDMCDGISRSIQKVSGMPLETLILGDWEPYTLVDETRIVFCFDHWSDILTNYADDDGDLTEEYVINEFVNWDSYINDENFPVTNDPIILCCGECEESLETRWGNEHHVFAICRDCNIGYSGWLRDGKSKVNSK